MQRQIQFLRGLRNGVENVQSLGLERADSGSEAAQQHCQRERGTGRLGQPRSLLEPADHGRQGVAQHDRERYGYQYRLCPMQKHDNRDQRQYAQRRNVHAQGRTRGKRLGRAGLGRIRPTRHCSSGRPAPPHASLLRSRGVQAHPRNLSGSDALDHRPGHRLFGRLERSPRILTHAAQALGDVAHVEAVETQILGGELVPGDRRRHGRVGACP